MRHTGEKPHACQLCDRRFIQLVALRRHMKVHIKKADPIKKGIEKFDQLNLISLLNSLCLLQMISSIDHRPLRSLRPISANFANNPSQICKASNCICDNITALIRTRNRPSSDSFAINAERLLCENRNWIRTLWRIVVANSRASNVQCNLPPNTDWKRIWKGTTKWSVSHARCAMWKPAPQGSWNGTSNTTIRSLLIHAACANPSFGIKVFSSNLILIWSRPNDIIFFQWLWIDTLRWFTTTTNRTRAPIAIRPFPNRKLCAITRCDTLAKSPKLAICATADLSRKLHSGGTWKHTISTTNPSRGISQVKPINPLKIQECKCYGHILWRIFSVDKTNRPKYECAYCEKIFYRKLSMEKHIQLCALDQKPEIVAFICETCGKDFKKQSYLTSHRFTHIDPEHWPFLCEHCPKRFVAKHKFRAHMLSHVGGTMNYACLLCDTRTSTQKALDAHMVYHNPEYSHPCDKCESKFRNPGTG